MERAEFGAVEFRTWVKIPNTQQKYPGMYPVMGISFDARIVGVVRASGFAPNIFGFDDIELMQYARLPDKNGAQICQGDRLKYEVKGFPIRTAVVEKSPGRFTFYWEDEKREESHTLPLFPYSATCWEIIGNIWENPEPGKGVP